MDGYCLQNTQTPDGYSVDMQGGPIEGRRDANAKQEVQAQMEEQGQRCPTGSRQVQEQLSESGAQKQIGNVLTVPEEFLYFIPHDERGYI